MFFLLMASTAYARENINKNGLFVEETISKKAKEPIGFTTVIGVVGLLGTGFTILILLGAGLLIYVVNHPSNVFS